MLYMCVQVCIRVCTYVCVFTLLYIFVAVCVCDCFSHLPFSVMICTGLSWLLLLPVPSWPYVLAPQVFSSPSFVRAN